MTTAEQALSAIHPNPPIPARPGAMIEGVLVDGTTCYVSGVVAFNGAENPPPGKVGRELTVDEGAEQAKLAVANALHRLVQVLGSLDRVARVLKLMVYVNSTDDLTEQPQVANGGSQVLHDVLGERGRHARSAVGVVGLPLGAAVEIDLVVRLTAE